MKYLDNWQKDMSPKNSAALIIIFILIFMGCEYILFSRLRAEKSLQKGMNLLEKARSLSADLLVNKSLLYQSALKHLGASVKSNPYDAKPYFVSGEAASDIEDNQELASSLIMKPINSSKLIYTKAILSEPTNAIYHQRLGHAYAKSLDNNRAEQEFNKALLLNPQNISMYLYLIQYYLSKDKKEIALSYADRIDSLCKSVPWTNPCGEARDFLANIGLREVMKK